VFYWSEGDSPSLFDAVGDSPSLFDAVGDSPSLFDAVGESPSLFDAVGESPTLLSRSFATATTTPLALTTRNSSVFFAIFCRGHFTCLRI
jgi:hypothetical protein